MSSDAAEVKRPYDATRRRERAIEQRQATRARVIEAATRSFVARGYSATTMAEIAREAGVAMQSVYDAGQSKAELLRTAVERAVAGDDQDILIHERPAWAAIRDEPDPVCQVRRIVGVICEVLERSASIQQAFREAAAVDPAVAATLERAHKLRRESIRMLVHMLPEEWLRHSYAESTDTVWVVASTDVWLLLRNHRRWSEKHIRNWFADSLLTLLLTTPPDVIRGGPDHSPQNDTFGGIDEPGRSSRRIRSV